LPELPQFLWQWEDKSHPLHCNLQTPSSWWLGVLLAGGWSIVWDA
jgi:hypothetical protein